MGADENLVTQPSSANYPPTPWSQIIAAKEEDSKTASPALERLCLRYRPVIVGYFRVKLEDANAVENAEDLAHSFFATRWIEKSFFQRVDRGKAPRFRHYLASSLASFYIDWLRHSRTQKNNRGQTPLPINQPGIPDGIDVDAPEARDQTAVDEGLALRIHSIVREQLQQTSDKPELLFRLARFILVMPDAGDYTLAADELKLPVNNVKQRIRRWRSRYVKLFHEEVAALVEKHPDAVAQDAEYLLKLILGAGERGEKLW